MNAQQVIDQSNAIIAEASAITERAAIRILASFGYGTVGNEQLLKSVQNMIDEQLTDFVVEHIRTKEILVEEHEKVNALLKQPRDGEVKFTISSGGFSAIRFYTEAEVVHAINLPDMVANDVRLYVRRMLEMGR